MTTIFYGEPKFQYKGWIYCPESDVEPDNVKIFHNVITPDKRRISFDWSPYCVPSLGEFSLWVDLGCPDRLGGSPLNLEDLKKIRASQARAAKMTTRDTEILMAKAKAKHMLDNTIKMHKLSPRMVEILQVLSVATLRNSSLPASAVTLALVRRGLATQQPNGRVTLIDAGETVIKILTRSWWDYLPQDFQVASNQISGEE